MDRAKRILWKEALKSGLMTVHLKQVRVASQRLSLLALLLSVVVTLYFGAAAVSFAGDDGALERAYATPLERPATRNKSVKVPSLDQQAVRVGLGLLDKKNSQAAQRSFERALSHNPANLKARLHLVKLLQEQNKGEEALALIEEGVQLLPGNSLLKKKYARHLIKIQQPEAAVRLLQKNPRPALQDDPEYYALLAALFQQLGQYDKAASVYGHLVALNRDNGVWWLGLGLSMDQQGKTVYAREAYQKTLNFSRLDAHLKAYVQRRLNAL